MAMDMGGAKGGIKSDINVTPLVDVMLVLLIIMMVIAPMLQQGIVVNLPEALNTNPKPDTSDQTTVVQVDGQGAYYVNAVPSTLTDLPGRVKAALEAKAAGVKVVYLKGDKDAPYESIMKMMDALRASQIENVALITERNDSKKKGGK